MYFLYLLTGEEAESTLNRLAAANGVDLNGLDDSVTSDDEDIFNQLVLHSLIDLYLTL